jgi:hypothetical protein
MREWKRGEIQAIGAVAKLMILGGGFVALFTGYLDFNYATFVSGLPATLTSGAFPTLFGAVLVLLLGCALGCWLWKVGKRTGISTRPFDRD